MGILDALRARVEQWARGARREERQVRGFPVVVDNSRDDIATPAVLARLDEALALVERCAPQRFRHLRRDVARIWVVRYPCRGAFLVESRSCVTELTFLARRDIPASVVASSILHEGVHARVAAFRRRVGGTRDEENHAREERLCRRAEIAFGRALPAELGAPVLDRAQASLALEDEDVAPAIDWTVAQARIAAADAGSTARPREGA